MSLTIKTPDPPHTFDQIDVGRMFLADGNLYIKTKAHKDNKFVVNAYFVEGRNLDLRDDLHHFEPKDRVFEVCDVDVTINLT